MIDVDIEFYQIEHRTHNILLLQEASVKVIFRMMEIMCGASGQVRMGSG